MVWTALHCTVLGFLSANSATVESCTGDSTQGGALGPDWSHGIPMKGQSEKSREVQVEYECEVTVNSNAAGGYPASCFVYFLQS